VRLIDEEGGQLGVVPAFQALQMARERGLDLVEVAPNATPPVCRILDYGKFKYEQSKKEREARKHQHNVVLREIRMKAKIDDHDVDFKTRTVEKLLKEGDKVKVSVMFRGREQAHPELGRALLDRIFERVKDHGAIEKPPGLEGRHMTMILTPGAAKPAKEAKPPPPRVAAPVGE
jgi:translation initiation factor IF-3